MAVQAELKSLDSADIPGRWEDWHPDDAERFALHVTAGIGPAGADGCEWFSFWICTPGWVAASEELPKGFAFGRYLLVSAWEPDVIDRAIRDLCRRTRGETWSEVAAKLSRFARWEFEDYTP